MREGNSLGVKILKSIVIFLFGAFALYWVLTPLFSIFGPFIRALPFETPSNYIVADSVGIFVMIFAVVWLLLFTKKWGWR